ncbi:MAG: leuA [Verrucomicrobiaceae bacterium]|nr:leuA [Verrucomicrobiaceae bacterium]
MNTFNRTTSNDSASNNTTFNHKKYTANEAVTMTHRRWPDRRLIAAPQWCSVDLRDGNQALPKPMNTAQKHRMYAQLVAIGFKEIEVGFPAASQLDFDFVQQLIEQDLIPDDVTIQVLTQAREDIIARTFESLRGAKRAIVHVYNSTSPAQRKYVFNTDRDGIRNIAEQGARWVQQFAAEQPDTEWIFQYSPESFTQTELEFARDICTAVCDIWRPDQGQPVIINLPSTVEVHTPNVFADRIEWFNDNFKYREHTRLSVHTHNDRGCGVASAELAVLAGADRVEGTLLGNGERTGNMDIITMAMNLYSQGVDPQLDFSDMAAIVQCAEECTDIPTHVRHPWVGELVYTAFSGSHQDAIRKGLSAWDKTTAWDVPYLPIDPVDIGRTYEAVVRVNSQSGKGGVAFSLERDYGFQLPRALQVAFSQHVQKHSEAIDNEVSSAEIQKLFNALYVNRATPWQLQRYQIQTHDNARVSLQADLKNSDNSSVTFTGEGNGTLEAAVSALRGIAIAAIEIIDYHEHALQQGTASKAVCYVHVEIGGNKCWGVGIAEDSMRAALIALLSAVNSHADRQQVAA